MAGLLQKDVAAGFVEARSMIVSSQRWFTVFDLIYRQSLLALA